MKWNWFTRMVPTLFIAVCLLMALSAVTYGAEIESLEQLRWNANIALYGSRNIGQSFIAKENGLNKIAVFMANPRASAEKVIFHLRLNHYEEIEPEELEFLGLPMGEIYGSKSVGQTFLSSSPILSGIKILMANYDNRMNDQNVIFHLKKSPEDKRDLRKVIINASQIGDNQYFQFDFSPVYDAQDESYYFYLESPNSYPGNAVTARYRPSDIGSEGEGYLNGEPANGDLLFKEVTESTLAISDLLFKEISETDLVTLQVSASQIRHNLFHTFVFPIINSSRGKSFYFYLESSAADADSALYFQYDNTGRYWAGRMYVDDLPYQGSLSFKTYYHIGLGEVGEQFLENLSKDGAFLIFYFTMAGLILSLLIVAIVVGRKLKKS